MADIAVTKAQVAPVHPQKAEIYDFIAAAAITAGQPVYIDSNGKAGVGDANDAAADQFRGIALNDASAGGAVSVLIRGAVYGFTISGLAYDAEVFVSNTAGSLADSAGGTTLSVGRVIPLSNKDLTKVLFVTGWAG